MTPCGNTLISLTYFLAVSQPVLMGLNTWILWIILLDYVANKKFLLTHAVNHGSVFHSNLYFRSDFEWDKHWSIFPSSLHRLCQLDLCDYLRRYSGWPFESRLKVKNSNFWSLLSGSCFTSKQFMFYSYPASCENYLSESIVNR